MRHYASLLSFLLLVPVISFGADPSTPSQALDLSRKIRQGVSSNSTHALKLKSLQSLESKLKQSLKDFEKKNPQQGTESEQSVAMLYYSLEPLFKGLSQAPEAKGCEKLRHQVELEDKGSKPETTPLTPEALEAMNWISVFCVKK